MKVGIDLTHIERFKNKDFLAKSILCDSELIEYEKSINKAQYLASRFALKEALIKCLELSILSVKLSTIHVMKKENGAVYIDYMGKEYNCSLSHEEDYCVGIVIND
jgi:phosphopantethiene--protein transferase domain